MVDFGICRESWTNPPKILRDDSIVFHLWVFFSFSWWCPLMHKFLILMKSSIPIFFFFSVLLVLYLRNYHLIQGHKDLLLCLLLGVIVLTLTFWSLICFELIFDMLWGRGSIFIPLHVHMYSSQHWLLKRFFFRHWIILAPFLKINFP